MPANDAGSSIQRYCVVVKAMRETLTIFDVSCYIIDMDTTTLDHALPVRDANSTEACCGGEVAAPALDAPRSVSLAERLKALADPTRLRMLDLLTQQTEPLCVCEITAEFDLQQPTISHHIRILRQAGLIAGEKRGVWSYYWATDEGKRVVSIVQTLA